MRGKQIRIYLAEGIPTGVLTAEIINWTGKVIVAPRSKLAEVSQRDETKRTGIYCLVGDDPDSPTRDLVYIGEGDNVLKRLTQHDRDPSKDFWSRAVIVISKDENLTKSHVRYLESRLIQIAGEARRATLANGNTPDPPPLPEPDRDDMEFFLDEMKMILPVLGFTFLQVRPARAEPDVGTGESVSSPTFVLSQAGASATAHEIDGEMIVHAGSKARAEGVPSWTSYKSLREQLVKEKKLVPSDTPELLKFTEDVAFNSPSAAGAVVLGRNTNGRTDWKVQGADQTYQEWHDASLDRAAEQMGESDEGNDE